ncbi:ATP-binding protein [Psychrobacillus vulpis]|uniref:ATP-binding protein n=1 Tax=Psychrobacillus vulpis TaxID=2325572 RepID=UPI00140A9056|nr:ATP-binding protein [Psychrobacillus vulpis]
MTFVLMDYQYKQKFEHVFQLFSSGLIFINNKGTILEVNLQAEEILQINRNELNGMNALNLLELFSESFESKKIFIEELLRTGKAELFSEIRTFLGEVKYINIKVSKQEDTDLFLTEIHDESEKMKMKKRLDHTESLSTLGQLAASIAHEIRNPMTSLKGFTQLLYETATDDGKRYLSVIDDEIKRMEEILTEFLEVSKPTNNKFDFLEVEGLILEVANFMAPQALMQNIESIIKFELDNTCTIYGDRSLLKQVFMNAIKNAIEAMPTGGIIHITVSSTSNNKVCIEIRDQGHGIEEDKLDKIFEPYFTTKSSGTGLGLCHVNRVITSHEGTIEVDSVVGKGTNFKFFLPIHDKN